MTAKERVVVIGGLGFIGKRLTLRLRSEGHSVTVVSRSAGSKGIDEPGLSFEAGDVSDPARMLEVIRGATLVYDLSLGGGTTWADYERCVVGGAGNVARACLQHGVRRLIYTSSISALYLGGGGTMDESSGCDSPNRNRGMYPRGKILAEKRLLAMHAGEKLPVVIFRPGVVVGNGGALVHFVLGERPADGTCVLGWGRGKYPLPCVLVDDVVDALASAKDAPDLEGLVFNLAGDVRPTAAEYVRLIGRRSRRNFRFYPRSLWSIQAGEFVRFLLKKLSGRSNLLLPSYRDLKHLSMATQLDCSLAKRLLAWTPVSDLEEFLRQAVDCHLEPIPQGDLRLEDAG